MVKKCSFIVLVSILLLVIMPFRATHAGSATVQLVPSTSTVDEGVTFAVDVTVAGVTDLAVWEFRLFYLSSVLSCTGAVNGSFLETGGTQFFTFAVYAAYDATHGCLLFGASLIGSGPGVNGSGTLATITFQAVGAGDTQLHFDNDPVWNFLKDSTPPPRHLIPYTTIDGTVHVTGVHDVAVTNVTSLKTALCQSCGGNVTVTVANHGGDAETFNVTAYVNNTATGNLTGFDKLTNVVLAVGASANFTLLWNTTGFAKGNYTLIACATPVPGETHVEDNNFTDGLIVLSILGDITGGPGGVPDGTCDMKDIRMAAKGFGANLVTDPASPKYGQYWTISTGPFSPNCDITGPTSGIADGTIDMRDIRRFAQNFGKTDP